MSEVFARKDDKFIVPTLTRGRVLVQSTQPTNEDILTAAEVECTYIVVLPDGWEWLKKNVHDIVFAELTFQLS